MRTPPTLLGKRVRKARLNLGWSQQELADHIGYSMMTVCYIETGRTQSPNLDLMTALARSLRVPLDYLAGLVDAPYDLPCWLIPRNVVDPKAASV